MTGPFMPRLPAVLGRGDLLQESLAFAQLPVNVQVPQDVWSAQVGSAWGILDTYSDDMGGGARTWTNVANNQKIWDIGALATGTTYEVTILYRKTANSGNMQCEIWQYPLDGSFGGQRWQTTIDLYAAAYSRHADTATFTVSEDSRVEFRVKAVGTKQAASGGLFIDFVGFRIGYNA